MGSADVNVNIIVLMITAPFETSWLFLDVGTVH